MTITDWLQTATKNQFADFIDTTRKGDFSAILREAEAVRQKHYGNRVYLRALIEFTNYCKNDCYYCGLRKSNLAVRRYRLSTHDILSCCEKAYALGLRTFVLQSGEDPYFHDERMVRIVSAMRERFADCAITLSIGERSRASYQALFDAGANRYLLRHETANEAHYRILHPPEMRFQTRRDCLLALKDIGFQIGAGFMVASPGQTADTLADDLLFLRELQPQMIGIGPFIPQKDTPFFNQPAGTTKDTLLMLALTRLIVPRALLPSTTALSSIDPLGRVRGLRAGGNVVMPNVSPLSHRKDYALYDNKAGTDNECAENLRQIESEMACAGLVATGARGDHVDFAP